MPSLSWRIGLVLAAALSAQTPIIRLKELHRGMRGVGKTVFSGTRVEEFQVEILGVLENVGPRQSNILARLSGGPLASAGVLQGMSGSPVYIGGRLAGAVAFAFPFAKEPIAGIRPIEEMLGAGPQPGQRSPARISLWEKDLTRPLDRPAASPAAEARMADIATPVSFGGFTSDTIERFALQLRALGLEPRQGIGGGGKPGAGMGDAATLQPGSMISVQLVTGDMSVGADGTVTVIDGKRIYAFGHRFLNLGATELPFARAEVLALLPTLSSSFKISTPREWLGAITSDASTAVSGEVGRRAAMVPVSIAVNRRAARHLSTPYKLEVVNDRFLTPLLVQIAVFSAIDATERSVGASTFALRGRIEFQGASAAVRLDNMFSGEVNVPMQVSLAAALPVAYAMQSGFDSLRLKGVTLDIDSYTARNEWQIDQVWSSRPAVRPGETVDLHVVLAGDNDAELKRKVSYQVPIGAPLGPLYFTVADGMMTNLAEYQLFTAAPKSTGQVISLLNSLRGNTKAYVRVWRAEPGYQIQGADLPDPPPSVSMILSRNPWLGGAPAVRNSKLAELEVGVESAVVSGAKTLQVEVKE